MRNEKLEMEIESSTKLKREATMTYFLKQEGVEIWPRGII